MRREKREKRERTSNLWGVYLATLLRRAFLLSRRNSNFVAIYMEKPESAGSSGPSELCISMISSKPFAGLLHYTHLTKKNDLLFTNYIRIKRDTCAHTERRCFIWSRQCRHLILYLSIHSQRGQWSTDKRRLITCTVLEIHQFRDNYIYVYYCVTLRYHVWIINIQIHVHTNSNIGL